MTAFDSRQLTSIRVHQKYIKKFDQFLMRCGEDESDTIVLSRFRLGLEDELRRELIIRDISTQEQAIQIV